MSLRRSSDTPAGALSDARENLVQRVERCKHHLADAIAEQDRAEKDLADANAKLKAMDEFIERTRELAS